GEELHPDRSSSSVHHPFLSARGVLDDAPHPKHLASSSLLHADGEMNQAHRSFLPMKERRLLRMEKGTRSRSRNTSRDGENTRRIIGSARRQVIAAKQEKSVSIRMEFLSHRKMSGPRWRELLSRRASRPWTDPRPRRVRSSRTTIPPVGETADRVCAVSGA